MCCIYIYLIGITLGVQHERFTLPWKQKSCLLCILYIPLYNFYKDIFLNKNQPIYLSPTRQKSCSTFQIRRIALTNILRVKMMMFVIRCNKPISVVILYLSIHNVSVNRHVKQIEHKYTSKYIDSLITKVINF